MILGKIIGKTSTNQFNFLIREEAKKFQYVQVLTRDGTYVLGQIIDIEKEKQAIAKCIILGYREKGILRTLRSPLEPDSEVLEAEDSLIKEVLGLEKKNNAFIGTLDGKDNINVHIDINKLLTRHVAILAKSGSGKSYAVSVIIEELIERNIPVLIIDPHGEYSSLKYPNDNKQDIEDLKRLDLKPLGYLKQVNEFSPNIDLNTEARSLKLNSRNLSPRELVNLLPARLSNLQLNALYSSIKNLGGKVDFNSLIFQLEMEESSAKWTLINIVEYLQELKLFSEDSTDMSELIQPGKCTLVNLRGIQQELQEVVVYKLLNDLFTERKKENIPPFFLVLEEAHLYVPERSFGEAKSSSIIRQIFTEGRKFGLGACLISQRPSRIDKSALSQTTTQIILKVTNPLDVKAISNSVEGITSETEKEIKNLTIGTAIVTGILDMPLFVNIRARKSKHGGRAVEIFKQEEKDFMSHSKEFEQEGELLPLIKQKINLNDYKIMNDLKEVKIKLIPCGLFICENDAEFKILVNLNNGQIIQDLETGSGIKLDEDFSLSSQQSKVFNIALRLKEFTAAELFSKSGIQFSEVYDIINILTKKGYFIKDGDSFRISKRFEGITNIENFAISDKMEYSRIDYNEKLEKNFDLVEIKKILNNFIDVKDKKDCFLVTYS